MPSQKISELCEAIDTFGKDEEFTTADLRGLGVSSATSNLVPLMVEMGYAVRASAEGARPARFKRATEDDGSPKSMVIAYENGEFNGFFSALAKRKGEMSGQPRQHKSKTEDALVPQEQQFEINIYDIAEQLTEDQFGSMVAGFLRLKNAQIKPLQEKIMYLEDQARIRAVEHSNSIQLLENKVNSMSQELLRERENVINLRNQLTSAEETRVRGEAPVRVITVGSNGINQKDSGSSGGRPGGVMVHGRPYVGSHVPRPVIEHRKK